MGSGKYYLETQNMKWNFLINNNPSFYWVNLWVNPPTKTIQQILISYYEIH